MADITFVNNTLIPGTTFNPGLEEVLDRNGTLGDQTATTFTITNDSGGALDGFRFELKGTNFAFTNGIPNAGTITSISVKAPDGTTQIIEVAAGAGGFGNTNLKTFFDNLTGPNGGVFTALDSLLSGSDVITGSAVADHATAFGFGFHTLLGNGGDDVLTARFSATLVGGTGNDTIAVGDDDFYVVAGADLNGLGGAGETNTLEMRGEGDNFFQAEFDSITDIDALRFVDTKPPTGVSVLAPDLSVEFLTSQIGNGLVSLNLAVRGSTTSSPLSQNSIEIFRESDPTDTTAVNLDLSGWTFSDWNQARNSIIIGTNRDVALNDRIVGTSVADFIQTHAGNDTIQGGRGADGLNGGDGSDTFVYGLNEAAKGEGVFGDDFPNDGGIDKVLVLANNNFTGVDFFGIEQLVFGGKAIATFDQNFFDNSSDGGSIFANISLAALGPNSATVVGDGNANTLAFVLQNQGGSLSAIDLSDVVFRSWSNAADKIVITGTRSHDAISGSNRNDIINGGTGSDLLQGNGGADAFRFTSAFGKGVDHIADFSRAQHDVIQLEKDIFTALNKGALAKAAFALGTRAGDANDRIIYDTDNGVIRYDADGTGKGRAHIVAVLDGAPVLTNADFFVI